MEDIIKLDRNVLSCMEEQFVGRICNYYVKSRSWKHNRWIQISTPFHDDENVHYKLFCGKIELHFEGDKYESKYGDFIKHLESESQKFDLKLGWGKWKYGYRCQCQTTIDWKNLLEVTKKFIVFFDEKIKKWKERHDSILAPRSIGEILREKFFIPAYQRGYRWTSQEVRDLLDDIYEFSLKEGKKKGEFYSLQPLVVKGKYDSYEVVDGQQRLTTIFLILKYLGNPLKEYMEKPLVVRLEECLKEYIEEPMKYLERSLINELKKVSDTDETLKDGPYYLTYETRKKGIGTLKPEEKEETEPSNGEQDNIDFFHMRQAYKEIEGWFEGKNQKDFLKILLNNVKFIWYNMGEYEDPIKVFTRLNIGKIPLTNAELIKALFLNSSNFGGNNDERVRLRQQEIASEWDQIEYTLQNEEFWQFIHDGDYENPTRIDFIFDLICRDFNERDEYRTFRYFYDSFKRAEKDIVGGTRKAIESARENIKMAEKEPKKAEKYIKKAKKCIETAKKAIYSKGEKIEGKGVYEDTDEINRKIKEKLEVEIEDKWKEVKRIFQIFQEWFNDLEIYHYVGFLLVEPRPGQLLKLLDAWKSKKKKSFKKFLIKEIKEKIKEVNCLSEQYEFDPGAESHTPSESDIAGSASGAGSKEKKSLDKRKCRPLLLLHNIQTIIDQNKNSDKKYGSQVFYKFPFHIFKNESWDVEHIDSNTPNKLDKPEEQRGWLFAIKDIVKKKAEYVKKKAEGPEDDILKRIRNFYKNPESAGFDELKYKIKDNFLKEEEEKFSQKEKNQIWNFALLDASTNRGYGNSIFSAKRRSIIGKDKGKKIKLPNSWDGELEEVDAESSFIPPCTKYVFLKYYSAVSSSPNSWTKNDAKAYKNNIYKTLKKFEIKANSSKKSKNE